MQWSGPCGTTCAAGAGAEAGAGASVPFLVGVAAPERRKILQEFEWPSVVLSVLGTLSVLLDCDRTNTLLLWCLLSV